MTKKIQAIKGMNDYLPADTAVWQQVESTLKEILASYGYSEIRLPIVEFTSLFQRAIGEVTDVVEKEMFTFTDRDNVSISLRPEGTAGCVRAGIENGLIYNQEQRLWYLGPMFRYEKPQKGRYRQFYQMGVEAFGINGPDIDAEVIALTARWWKALGISEYVSLELNSIGSPDERGEYRKDLVAFLENHQEILDDDCRRRMYTNPLRVFDSKNQAIQALLVDAPKLSDYFGEITKTHFAGLCELLKELNIDFTINERLVRGLDYYNYTVFEWVTTHLGAQGTICGGGRYDGLVSQLGGHPSPAIGFAMGMERLVLLVQAVASQLDVRNAIDIYMIAFGQGTQSVSMQLAEHIRDMLPGVRVLVNQGGGNAKKQFTRADKCGAKLALVLGESEIATQRVIIKDLRTGNQEELDQTEMVARLSELLD